MQEGLRNKELQVYFSSLFVFCNHQLYFVYDYSLSCHKHQFKLSSKDSEVINWPGCIL